MLINIETQYQLSINLVFSEEEIQSSSFYICIEMKSQLQHLNGP